MKELTPLKARDDQLALSNELLGVYQAKGDLLMVEVQEQLLARLKARLLDETERRTGG